MNAVPSANEQATVQPAPPKLLCELSDLPREAEAALTFDTAHIRAETVTSVLENILRGSFITHRGRDETGR